MNFMRFNKIVLW